MCVRQDSAPDQALSVGRVVVSYRNVWNRSDSEDRAYMEQHGIFVYKYLCPVSVVMTSSDELKVCRHFGSATVVAVMAGQQKAAYVRPIKDLSVMAVAASCIISLKRVKKAPARVRRSL